MEIEYYVRKNKDQYEVKEKSQGVLSSHLTRYEAWKDARRLARGTGAKARLNKHVVNNYVR